MKDTFTQEFKKINTLDGIRIELEEGWALLRPSNTSPLIRLTVEADTENLLNQITEKFKNRTIEMIATMINK